MCVCARDATCSKRECCQRSLKHCCCCCCFSFFFLPRLLLANCQPQDTDTQHSCGHSQYSLFWILLGVLGTHNTRCTNTLFRALSLPLSLVRSLSLSLSFLPHSHFSGVRTLFAQFVRLSLHFALGCVSSGSLLGQARPQKILQKKKHNIENNLTT